MTAKLPKLVANKQELKAALKEAKATHKGLLDELRAVTKKVEASTKGVEKLQAAIDK